MFFAKDRTFKAKRTFAGGHILHKVLEATFGSLDMRDAVRCPPDSDVYEWLAVNTVDFFNQSNIIYGNLMEFCTHKTCPQMNAGPKYQYLWADGEVIKKPIKCSAPDYVGYLMEWIESKLGDAKIFPAESGEPFDDDFLPTVKAIFKRMFRIYAHIYYSHFKDLEMIKADSYCNLSFKHFIFFAEEFHLIDANELKPLSLIIKNLHEKEAEMVEHRAQRQQQHEKERKPFIRQQQQAQSQQQPASFPQLVISGPQPPAFSNESLFSPGPRTNREPSASTVESYLTDISETIPNGIAPLTNLHISTYSSDGNGNPATVADTLLLPPTPSHVTSRNETTAATIFNGDPSPQTAETACQPAVLICGSDWDAQLHARLFMKAGYRLAALWAPAEQSISTVQQLAAALGISEYSNDRITGGRELIARTDCRVCYVASGAFDRAREDQQLMALMEWCAECQVHLCVSPLSLPLAKRRSIMDHWKQLMEETAAAMPAVSQMDESCLALVNHPLRSLPAVQRLWRELNSEQRSIGKVLNCQISLQNGWRRDGDKFDAESAMLKDISTLAIANTFDLLGWLFGTPIATLSSRFFCANPDEKGIDYGSISFELEEGSICGTITMSFVGECADFDSALRIEITGTQGYLRLVGNRLWLKTTSSPSNSKMVLLADDQTAESTQLSDGMPVRLLSAGFLHFTDVLRSILYHPERSSRAQHDYQPKEMVATLADGYRNMRVLEATRRQNMFDLSFSCSVNELLRISPKRIRRINDDMNNLFVVEQQQHSISSPMRPSSPMPPSSPAPMPPTLAPSSSAPIVSLMNRVPEPQQTILADNNAGAPVPPPRRNNASSKAAGPINNSPPSPPQFMQPSTTGITAGKKFMMPTFATTSHAEF